MEKKNNQLLGALEEDVQQRLRWKLTPVVVKLGDVICEAGGTLEHAYFPQGAVLSLLTVMVNGTAIETANIGREGAFGIFAAMYSRVSFNRCRVQLADPMVLSRSQFCRRNLRRAPTYGICLSAIREPYCSRSSRRLPVTRFIPSRSECVAGCE